MSSSAVPLALGTEQGQLLQSSIKSELSRRHWSDGDDDEVMAEYILVMLANNKTSDQIATELEELVGEGSGGDASEGSVRGFVGWLWQERDRIAHEATAPKPGKVEHTLDIRSRRRSRSPIRRPREEQFDRRDQRQNGYGDHSDRWHDSKQGTRMQIDRESRSRPTANGRPRRELFDSIQHGSSSKMASDGMEGSRSDHQNGPQVHADESGHQDINPDTAQQRRPIRIAGTGSERMFQRSLQQAQKGADTSAAGESLFARVSMPDPRAQEFIPKISTESDLLTRLDPMLPDNHLPSLSTTSVDVNMVGHQTDYPTAPLDPALCRYSLKCTNPMCPFSHPSVASVAASKTTGDEPLVLRQESCRYQQLCKNADCPFSHVSPSVAFVLAKANGQVSSTSIDAGSGPCRFQLECKNPSCTFSHYDPASGGLIPPPAQNVKKGNLTDSSKIDQALSEGTKPCRFGVACTRKDCHFSHPSERQLPSHVSNRLARFGDSEVEGAMETIIPAAS